MLSKQPGDDPPSENREVTHQDSTTKHPTYDELQEINELLHEQIVSLQLELNEKDEQLGSLKQELHATNQEIDLINQELQSQAQHASLSLLEALQIAQQLLLTSLPDRVTIAQLLSKIYATTIDVKQLNFNQSLPQITPQLYLTLVTVSNAQQRRRLRHQFIELGTRFVGSVAGHTKLKQKFRELTIEQSYSDAEIAELAKAVEALASEIPAF